VQTRKLEMAHKASIEKSFPVFKEQPWNLKFAHQTGRNETSWLATDVRLIQIYE
jgi:hypothetical protein